MDDREQQKKTWATLRARAPVWRDEPSKSFVLTRYADVRALLLDTTLLRDPDLADEGAVVRQFKSQGPERDAPMTWLDGPEHVRVRGPLQRALYARIAAARPAIEKIVHMLLDSLVRRETFDLVADYAVPIPVAVIGNILGVATTDFPRFRAWSDAMMLAFHPARSQAQDAAMAEANTLFAAYLDAAIAERRVKPRDDLLSDLVIAQRDGAQLSDVELRVNCSTLLTGGNMSTADLIGNAALLLLQHPEQCARLKADPSLAASAVEECLRLSPPTDGTQRVLGEDRTIGGCPMKKGQVVAVVLPSANLDPDAFPDPERFDIARKPNVHLSFGGGPHICIGAPLARLEAQVALGALFARFPGLHLTGVPPERRELPFFNGLESLIVAA
ncbi:MAG TPA: cytochrome P450 [Rhizomicrobium sp.]|jgi:hypothetical protein